MDQTPRPLIEKYGITALEFVFPTVTYREKANFHVIFEQIDSKCPIKNVGLAVNKEADREKSRPEILHKFFDEHPKRYMGKWLFYVLIDRRGTRILLKGLVIKVSSLL